MGKDLPLYAQACLNTNITKTAHVSILQNVNKKFSLSIVISIIVPLY